MPTVIRRRLAVASAVLAALVVGPAAAGGKAVVAFTVSAQLLNAVAGSQTVGSCRTDALTVSVACSARGIAPLVEAPVPSSILAPAVPGFSQAGFAGAGSSPDPTALGANQDTVDGIDSLARDRASAQGGSSGGIITQDDTALKDSRPRLFGSATGLPVSYSGYLSASMSARTVQSAGGAEYIEMTLSW